MISKEDKFSSFTAADSFPIKLAQDWNVIRKIVEQGFISPVHLQVCPTNKCTRNCSFCSCSYRDKKLELSFEMIQEIIRIFTPMGTQAVTITGGGDPCCHEDINEIIHEFKHWGIDVGLVTNADLISKITVWEDVTWCRISCSDTIQFNDKWADGIIRAVNKGPNVDWAFSYVLTNYIDLLNIRRHLLLANELNFTHMRIVADILNYSTTLDLRSMAGVGDIIQNDLVLYQDRKHPVKGMKDCRISLLKPIIDASGNIFPCCGTQYAEKEPTKDFGINMNMGHYTKAPDIWFDKKYFNGSICETCYYQDYNDYLKRLSTKCKHEDFV